MFLVQSDFTIKYLRISLGCIHSIVTHWCGQSLSVPVCTHSVCWQSKDSNPYREQCFSTLFEHFEHFFPADLNGSPQCFSRALYEATYKAVLPLQTQQWGCQNSQHPARVVWFYIPIRGLESRVITQQSSESGPVKLETHPDTCTHRRNLLAYPWRIGLPKKHPVYRWALKLVEKAWRLQQRWLMKRHTHIHLCHQSCC